MPFLSAAMRELLQASQEFIAAGLVDAFHVLRRMRCIDHAFSYSAALMPATGPPVVPSLPPLDPESAVYLCFPCGGLFAFGLAMLS